MSAFRNFIVTLLFSLAVFGLIAFFAVKYASKAIKNSVERQETVSEQTDDTEPDDSETSGTQIDPITVNGDSFTILFAVTDYRPDVYHDYTPSENDLTPDGFPVEPRGIHTDIILLVRIEKSLGECVVCAIPSNISAKINGLQGQIRGMYAEKGAEELCTKVMAMIGIPVNYYAITDYDGYKKIIDKFGPVSFTVSKDISFHDDETDTEFTLRKGTQKLDGSTAMKLLTYNGYGDGGAQMRKYNAVFAREICKLAITEANKPNARILYNEFISEIKTNFTLENLQNELDLIFSFPKMTVTEYSFPGKVTESGGVAYFSPDLTKAQEFFSAYKFKG